MAEKEWGIKRVCLGCGTRFYDFDKSPIVCPFCEAVFDPEHLSKRKARLSFDKSEDIEDIKLDLDDIPEEEDDEEDEEMVGVNNPEEEEL